MKGKEKLMLSNNRKVNLSRMIIMVAFAAILVMGVLGFGSSARAAEFICGTNGVDNSCTASGLQSLIDSASDGDTINIATGTHDWSSGDYPNGIVINKRITINGGGICNDCGDVETPSGSWPVTLNTVSSQNQVFRITCSDEGSQRVRITGIRFYGYNRHTYCWFNDYGAGAFIVEGQSNYAHVTIDNNQFHSRNTGDSFDATSIQTQSMDAYWLIHNNYFLMDGNDGHMITIMRGGTNPSGWAYGSVAQTDNVEFGSANFTFIEDNTMVMGCDPEDDYIFGPNVTDCFNGGRFVFRHNYVKQAFVGSHDLCGGTLSRGMHSAEVYENKIYFDPVCYHGNNFAQPTLVRSGTFLVHNNDYGTGWQHIIRLMYDRGSWGACDNANEFDGDSSSPDGYPCLDQPGWSDASGSTSATVQPQISHPIRIWNNTGTPANQGCNFGGRINYYDGWVCSSMGEYATEGVEFIYSADDSAELPGYVPYTYPHPLREESGPNTISPTHSNPDNFSLRQNYPNPFNPSTTIEYSVEKSCNVRIIIYNRLGQEVCALVNKQMSVGEYSVTWNGIDTKGNKLASGVYFYRLTAGKQVGTKKMLYLR